tara:strand:- start:30 stop:638 length:609 start_codon:yes stop_codon:yes gene_type:complete
MKKFLSLLFVAFSFSTALAQVKFTTTFEERDTGKKPTTGTYELMSDYVVIEAEGTALDLYNKTIDWINETYNTPSEVIKGQVESEYVRIAGSTKQPLYYYNMLKQAIPYEGNRYSIELRFKDNKVRFKPTKLECYIASSQYTVGGWVERQFEAKVANHKGKENSVGKKTMEAQVAYFSGLASRLDSYYENGGGSGSKSDDDW